MASSGRGRQPPHSPSLPPKEHPATEGVTALPDASDGSSLVGGYRWSTGRGSELGFHLLALLMLGEVKKASGRRLEG